MDYKLLKLVNARLILASYLRRVILIVIDKIKNVNYILHATLVFQSNLSIYIGLTQGLYRIIYDYKTSTVVY